MPSESNDYEALLPRIPSGATSPKRQLAVGEGGLAALRSIANFLERSELPIDAVERVEDVVKATIERLASDSDASAAAHDLALAMKRIGFFHKLKSYAVKAAS